MSLIFADQKLSTKVEYNENDTNLKNRDSVSKNCKSQGETNSCKNCDGEWATFNRAQQCEEDITFDAILTEACG